METANKYFGKSLSKNHIKLGISQLKLLLYTNSDPTYGPHNYMNIEHILVRNAKTKIDLENL